tara:strand:- start:693 stop:812 length:120 start_codon:yes stop_codon:yes gene_type:complete
MLMFENQFYFRLNKNVSTGTGAPMLTVLIQFNIDLPDGL